MSDGFVKLRRSEATWELLEDHKAFVLLTVIALRARRTDGFNRHGLQIGQALIGDYEACGLTEKQYRLAKARLERYGLARFKPTNRGTIATLLDASVYDINEDSAGRAQGKLRADERRTAGEQGATNKNEKNEKKTSCNAQALRLSELLFGIDCAAQGRPAPAEPRSLGA